MSDRRRIIIITVSVLIGTMLSLLIFKVRKGDAGLSGDDYSMLITNLENTCFSYGGCIDGILGFDFLSLHRIGFNFVKRKMYIWK